MNYREFTDCMDPVVQKFGKVAFDDHKIELIWKTVQNLDTDTLRAYVDQFIIGEDHRAKLSDFKNLAWQVRKTEAGESQDFMRDAACYLCRDSGAMLAQRRDKSTSIPYAFKCCLCRAGDGTVFPNFQKKHLAEYLLETPVGRTRFDLPEIFRE